MASNNTKQKIMDTAFGLFRIQGYDEVTVNDICSACGITKTTFYYHLKSKEQIISDFYNADILTISEKLLGVFNESNYWEQLMFCFDTLIDISAKIGADLFKQIFIMNLKGDKGTFDFNPALTNVAVTLIQKGQNEGHIRNKSNPAALYHAAAHTFEGFEIMWCIKNASFDRKQCVRYAMENIFDVAPEFRRNTSD